MAITRVTTFAGSDTGNGDAILTVTMPAAGTFAAGDSAVIGMSAPSGAATITLTHNGLSVEPAPIGNPVTFTGHQSRLWSLNGLSTADAGKVLTFTASVALKMAVGGIVLRGVGANSLVDAWTFKTAATGTASPTTVPVTTIAEGCGILEFIFPSRGNTIPQILVATKPATSATVGETIDVGPTATPGGAGQSFTTEANGATGTIIAHDSFGTGVATGFRAHPAGTTTLAQTYTLDQSAVYSAQTLSLIPRASGPTVDAGPDQTVAAGTVVTLSGTDSPSAGSTISSRQWTVVSSPSTAPAITNATSSTATVTVAQPGDYVFQYAVTDTSGTTTSRVNVYATTLDSGPIGVISNGGWTAVGAATVQAALADASATTWAETAPNPNSVTMVLDIPPEPNGNKTVYYDLQNESAGPTATYLVELLSGGSVVASWSETVTGTAVVPRSRVLTDAENAKVTNPNALTGRITGDVA